MFFELGVVYILRRNNVKEVRRSGLLVHAHAYRNNIYSRPTTIKIHRNSTYILTEMYYG